MKQSSKILLFCTLATCSFGLTGCWDKKTVTNSVSTPINQTEDKQTGQQLPTINPTVNIDLGKTDTQVISGYAGTVLAGKTVPLLDFQKSDYDTAKKANKNIILYFYANWCPICKEELPELYAAFNLLTLSNTIGFRVNYNDSDTDSDEKALAQEFGIAYQHSKVFIKNGQRILKAPDSWDRDRYISEIADAYTKITQPVTPEKTAVSAPKTYTIQMNDDGFTPSSLTIKKGDAVTFTNKGTHAIWPASGVHPTHNAYPEKGGCIGSTFDACKGVNPGESWTFTFTEVGTWQYHDHLHANNGGSIKVE